MRSRQGAGQLAGIGQADDEPAPAEEVIAHAAGLMGVPVPPEVPFEEADLSPMARSFYDDNKRVLNRRLAQELGVTLRYPTYREGLAVFWRDGAWRTERPFGSREAPTNQGS